MAGVESWDDLAEMLVRGGHDVARRSLSGAATSATPQVPTWLCAAHLPQCRDVDEANGGDLAEMLESQPFYADVLWASALRTADSQRENFEFEPVLGKKGKAGSA